MTAALARYARVGLLLYASSCALAIAAALPVALGTWLSPSSSALAFGAARGDYVGALFDLALADHGAQLRSGTDFTLPLPAAPAISVLLAATGALAEMALYAFLSGGAIAHLMGRQGLWCASRRFAWRMWRIGVLAALCVAVMSGVALAIPLPLGLRAIGLLVVLGYINGTLELARSDLVLHDRCKARTSLRRAFGLVRHPKCFAMATTMWLTLALLSALPLVATLLAFSATDPAVVLPALAAHQVGGLLGAGVKAVRLGAAVRLCAAIPFDRSWQPNPP